MKSDLKLERVYPHAPERVWRWGFVERVTTQSMTKRHRRHSFHVFFSYRTTAFKRRERA